MVSHGWQIYADLLLETALRERLAEAPSFVAFEGYDTIAVLAHMLRARGPEDPEAMGSAGFGSATWIGVHVPWINSDIGATGAALSASSMTGN